MYRKQYGDRKSAELGQLLEWVRRYRPDDLRGPENRVPRPGEKLSLAVRQIATTQVSVEFVILSSFGANLKNEPLAAAQSAAAD
ncbi:hypothetical protein WG922_14945 [Ramlibacter sp. AN1015]|uniref:hypothetical protein n=1 Tax=Ramlibacter sp. AN1015 TaxID=3133428 RepID=UPI0030BEB647